MEYAFWERDFSENIKHLFVFPYRDDFPISPTVLVGDCTPIVNVESADGVSLYLPRSPFILPFSKKTLDAVHGFPLFFAPNQISNLAGHIKNEFEGDFIPASECSAIGESAIQVDVVEEPT